MNDIKFPYKYLAASSTARQTFSFSKSKEKNKAAGVRNMYKSLQRLFWLLILANVHHVESTRRSEERREYPLIIHSGASLAVIINSQTGCQVSQLNDTMDLEGGEEHLQSYKVSNELLHELVQLCLDKTKEFNSPQMLITSVREHTRFLYPGTKYCGSGNSSTGIDDLGEYKATDRCCQEHDACQDYIPGRSCSRRIGLCNRTPFTRSSCGCDEKLRQCLMAANETSSKQIGKLYFNVFGLQCYRRDHPVVRCKRWGGFLHMHCQSYKLDYSKPKVWQFFDSPVFIPQENGLESEAFADEQEVINWLTLVFNP